MHRANLQNMSSPKKGVHFPGIIRSKSSSTVVIPRIPKFSTSTARMPGETKAGRRGLVEAMVAHGLADGTVVTASESAETTVDGRTVHIVSITEWLEEL